VPEKNGNKIKIAALTAVGGLIIVVITILGFAGGAVDGRIDNKIIVHEAETELVHQQNISDITQDIAVIQVQQKQITRDIGEIKELLREGR
jgi:hypothetical protein